jgi:hypothetical protein
LVAFGILASAHFKWTSNFASKFTEKVNILLLCVVYYICTSYSRNENYGLNHVFCFSLQQNLERPWEHEQKAELVLKILIACPDLMKCVLSNVEPYLEPRVSVKWLKAVNFVKQVKLSENVLIHFSCTVK